MSHSVSQNISVSYGVPRGLHLGHLLFNIYINDIPSVFNSSVNVLTFADGTKLN